MNNKSLSMPRIILQASLIFITWASFLLQGVSMAQSTTTMVELLEELQASASDSARVDIRNRIALRHLELNQLEKGYEEGVIAFRLARKTGFLQGEARVSETIARYYEYKNQFRKAIEHYNSSMHVFQHLDDSVQLARVMNSIGLVYKDISSFDTALVYFYRSKDILNRINDAPELANTFNLIGLVYGSWGDYQEALENFMASMDIYQDSENPLGISKTYCYIGFVYRKLNDLQRAEDYLNIALKLNLENGPTRDVTDIYTELGMLYGEAGRQQEAIEVFERGLTLSKYYGNQREVADFFDNLGSVYHSMEDYKQAMNFYERAKTIRQDLGIGYSVMVSNLNIASVYLSVLEHKVPGARSEVPVEVPSRDVLYSYLGNALVNARKTGSFSDLVRACESLARASAAYNDYGEAVRFQEALLYLKDSVEGLNQIRSVAELQTRFERDQQEQEIMLLKSQNNLQQTAMRRQRVERMIYSGSGITLVLLIIGLLNRMGYISRARNELERRNVQIGEEKRRAEQSEKVKEQFLSKMNHEIRIPMNTIMGSVNIILKNKPLESQQKYLSAIRQSSENLLVIIDDILDLTQLEAGRINLEEAPFSIIPEVRNIEQILAYKAAEKEIGLHLHIDESLPVSVIGDSTRLNQILLNLAGNAIKFTEKGSVTISIKNAGQTKDMVNVLFEVSDTGIGIPPQRLDRIFSSFTQADSDTTRKYGGTGLGLTISKQLVEMQNGKIGVTSEPGKGSTFFFEIPYKVVNSDQVVEGNVPELRGDDLTGLNILVVEDDEFNVMVLLETLTSALEGVTLDVAVNGKEALQKWSDGNHDVILMDIELPEMSGHEVTRAIRRSGRSGNGVPIIAMTANALQKEMEACFNAGMNDFVSKPFDQDDLIQKINRLMINQQKV